MLGNRDRLEVAAAIALSADGMVNATDLGRDLDLAQSRIRNQLVALAEGGLLDVFPADGNERKRWYRRTESPFWDLCLAVYEDWSK